MHPSPEDIRSLIEDKYRGDASADIADDLRRLSEGEPLAFVIGWVPFLRTRIGLTSRPLIPRVETEWWVERLIAHLEARFGTEPFSFLDLCAGSGAIGLAVKKALPNALVTLSELVPAHAVQIAENAEENALLVEVMAGDMFSPLPGRRFDIIATNPPYVPEGRELPHSVSSYEPTEALYSGDNGLSLIERIYKEAPSHLSPSGELWLECDSTHAQEVRELALSHGASESTINEDQYGRPRFSVSYYL